MTLIALSIVGGIVMFLIGLAVMSGDETGNSGWLTWLLPAGIVSIIAGLVGMGWYVWSAVEQIF